jgi:hypothetical protein
MRIRMWLLWCWRHWVASLWDPCTINYVGGWDNNTLREVWHSKIPTKIKIFLWQLIRGKLSSSDQIWKRHEPSTGECVLCGEIEDTNHIIFHCSLAKFMWACVKVLLTCSWIPEAGDLITISQSLSGRTRRIVWIAIALFCWWTWNIRNKMAIEKNFILHPTDGIFNMIICM